jgi:TetR/AcrR family transcriptional repressor of nem operon
MRYTAEHKQATHRRIVDEAATAFRNHGVDGIGLVDIMKGVGLTHGGFYAHFKSKDALVEEAVASALDQAFERLRDQVMAAPPEQRFATMVARYLSPRHRDARELGCAYAALGSDLARQPATVRAAAASRMDRMVRLIEEVQGKGEEAALAALSTMVGALTLSRIVEDGERSDRILADARKALIG